MILASKNKRLVFGWDWTRPNNWRERATAKSLAAFDAWDRAQRKRLGWRAGLRAWSKTNVARRRNLLSRHWPHKLCWDWLVCASIVLPVNAETNGLKLILSRRYRHVDVVLGPLHIHAAWQDSGYMAGVGPYRTEAPKLVWSDHLAHMEPRGTA